jgi:hypothetical protein
MMKKLFYLLFFGSLIGIKGQAPPPNESNSSSTLPNIVPPSPIAYALGNYGNVPVGNFTGSLNLQVEVTEFKSGKISIPISLFYSSNGLKVDDISGNVGIGWNLNFGGVVTKVVRDLDDSSQVSVQIPANLNGNTITSSIANAFFYEAGNPLADTEKDLYSFNFNVYSGKFIFDENNEPILYSQENLSIQRANDNVFIITTPDGTKYYFNDEERTSYRLSGDGFSNPGSLIPTAWYLSKISNNSGNEIYFNYESGGASFVISQSQSLKLPYPAPQIGCGGYLSGTPIISNIMSQNMKVKGKKIVKIFSNNQEDGEINFEYGSNPDLEGYFKISSISKHNKKLQLIDKIDFTYDVTTNNRTFLKKISFKDSNKNYGFDYINQELFPQRLDFGQDHWGYFNGKANVNLIPNNLEGYGLENFSYVGANKEPDSNFAQIGLLKKITYPTKGFTNFLYEGNDYFGTKTIYPILKERHLSIKTGPRDQDAMAQEIISVESDHWMKISGRSFFNIDCNEDTGHNTSILSILDENNEQVQLWTYSTNFSEYTYAQSNHFMEDGQEYFIQAKAGKQYTIKLLTLSNCTSAYCDIYYKDDPIITLDTNLPTGGVRVKSTESFGMPGSSPDFKKYFYANYNNLSRSSGNYGVTPIYYDTQINREYCPSSDPYHDPFMFVQNTFLVVNSSSVISLFNGNSNCYYPEVTISYGGNNFEKGGEFKQYYLNRDSSGDQVFGGHPIWSSPLNNVSWDNGLEKSSVTFDSNRTNLKEVVNDYTINNSLTKEVKSYSVRNNFEIKIMPGVEHICTGYEVANYPPNRCFQKTVGQTVNLPNFNNLDIIEYKNISFRHYLKSQKTTDYLNGTPLLTTTEYFYNNPFHYQVTSEVTTFPNKSISESTYKYAIDKGKIDMITANMVGIPLETTIIKKTDSLDVGKIISKTGIDYEKKTIEGKELILPNIALSYNLQNPSTSTIEVKYDFYDNKGNLLQYTTKSGIPTAIIWGYNQTQPIAKIEGVTYAQVSTAAQAIVIASDYGSPSYSEATLITQLDAFRTGLPNYQISTYTFKPLIGVTTITPPSGIREYYLYDTYNRLQSVQDVDGNILKEYQYNYKP